MNEICKVENLSFSYNPSKKIIDDVSFDIKSGEIVGILGKNGSGKTTILNLITGFLKGYAGSITIKGKNIKDFSLKERARTMSYLQQCDRENRISRESKVVWFWLTVIVLMSSAPFLFHSFTESAIPPVESQGVHL